ncbi:fungal-specific transcription factor domain-containing protein [Hypoxylon sp. FL1150]|nr:fungal-specific transcription factor domain-containing protein [Hypoxylon sp. FL1150]
MTRPKVDPDKRQRTAQACDSCKRRKQKCNGLQRCSTCEKRNLECMYTPTSLETGSQEPLGSPTKRRHVDSSPRMLKMEPGQIITAHASSIGPWSHNPDRSSMSIKPESPELNQTRLGATTRHFTGGNDRDFDSRSRISTTMSTTSGAADDAEQVVPSRMLETKTNKIQYIGQSANLAHLHLIRMLISGVAGETEFTEDNQRHNIVENTVQLPQGTTPTGVLPNRKTADALVNSFFVNTSGLIEVFHREEFLQTVEAVYNNPLDVDEKVICQLNLVFAIGLVMACPTQGTEEGDMIRELHAEPINRAELFYRNARLYYGPDRGFEDVDFWTVQALLLTSLYLLAISNRKGSYIYFGMAIHSAKALGLHREESMAVHKVPGQKLRRNVWRSLFVFDRFLAVCLGLPVTILEADCSEHALDSWGGPTTDESPMSNVTEVMTSSIAFDATVKSSMLIGTTLKRIYSRMKMPIPVAKELTDRLEDWEREMHQSLHCGRIMGAKIDPAEAVAVLHVNLLHCHSILLLTKPFFLCLIALSYRMGYYGGNSAEDSQKPPLPNQERLEKFSPACIEAAQRTIILSRAALDAEYLPQCNPFVIYFVFAAALVILSNEFSSLCYNPDAHNSIESAIRIFDYCENRDVQAQRLKYIVRKFHDANRTRPSSATITLPGRKIPTISIDSQSFGRAPTSYFFHGAKADRQDTYMSDLSPRKRRATVDMTMARSEPRMVPMIPPTLQQPSPEGSVSLNSGITAVTMAPGMDGLAGGDSEFDFEILMQGWNAPPGHGMGISHPMHPVETYGPYGLHQPPLPPVSGLHPHPTPYPPSDYR